SNNLNTPLHKNNLIDRLLLDVRLTELKSLNDFKILVNMIEETQSKNSYVKYGRYVEDCAKNLEWHKLLSTSIVAQTLLRMSLSPNNLILSGILDISTLINENIPTVMKALKKKKLDAITSQASLDRNNDKGPIKKYDIFGMCKDEKYNIELMLGEISHGPQDETHIHSIENRNKLGKGAKDSLD
ncbi:60_t:CDS:2, partial [Racocetra persica]